MKRIYVRLVLSFFIPLFFVGIIPQIASASVEDFNFSSFDADYYLSKDSKGHSSLRVVENLTAEFVNINQNKGIKRAIPTYYDRHQMSFEFESFARNGELQPNPEIKKEGQFEVIYARDSNYLNGQQKFTFTYILHDVTKAFDGHQELDLNTNGTGWPQSFSALTGRLHLDSSVKDDFTGALWCYQGPANSKEKCDSKAAKNEINFNSTRSLIGYENVTLSVAFKSGTFAEHSLTISELMPYVLVVVAIIAFIILMVIKFIYGRNNPGKGTIVPEYLPPNNTSVLMSSEIFDKPKNSITAQIIDLAVRHKIRINESEKKEFIGKTKEYSAELLNVEGLSQDELGLVYALFDGEIIDSKYIFNKNDISMGMKMKAIIQSSKDESKKIGYRVKQTPVTVTYFLVMVAMIALACITIYISLTGPNNSVAFFGCVLLGIFAALFFPLKLASINPLTAAGRGLFDYLKGLKMYIKLAEEERLKVLQSVEGAEKKQINTDDKAQMVVLYERVLPYAVLFGQEKSWLKHLGAFYENNQMQPGWYSGVGVFNATAFASSVSGFSNYSNSSTFGSGGGAGGGGFSGGGAGGGGGGGL